jgi:hypothetical protein
MRSTLWKYYTASIVVALFFVGCSSRQTIKENTTSSINFDTVHAGQYDTGKMWTFDFPPVDYFKNTYGFTPSKEWFEKARLSALRLPNCTASFVSEDGLVMTNHHCARSALDSVNREGERLAEDGFYAPTLEDERKAEGIFIDQLLVMKDVTTEIQQAFESGSTEKANIENRLMQIQKIQREYTEKYKILAPEDSMIFKVVSFYNGGRFSLYGYKRYTDVRLVYAPEEAMAFFGGDPDNFTYPRYDFDCAFFRVYENGKPLKTSNYFRFSQDGAMEGEAVFVIGNPGRTNRLKTIAQLEYLRDFEYQADLKTYERVSTIYSTYIEQHPEEKLNYLSTVFGLENSRKAINGYLSGLRDPLVMTKKIDFEKKFKQAVSNKSDLKTRYGDPWNDIAHYQAELAVLTPELNALKLRGRYFPKYLTLTADLIDKLNSSTDTFDESEKKQFYPKNLNSEIEKQLLLERLKIMAEVFKGKNEAFNRLVAGQGLDQAADYILRTSFLSSKEKTDALLAESSDSILKSPDPFISFIVATRERSRIIQRKYNIINEKLQASVQRLGKAMYDVYETQIPPDATFTLRIADGTIAVYNYNGTIAPPITTFYGMYDRYYSFGKQAPWKLSDRWAYPPASFKMNTPFNFISTNDIIGGNSGSPVINKNLQVVGIVFDGNIESLPGNIIYDETKNRSVSVHSSGILEGLEQIYKAERIVKELRAGKIMQ